MIMSYPTAMKNNQITMKNNQIMKKKIKIEIVIKEKIK